MQKLTATVLFALFCSTAMAESELPRLTNGKPNFSGVWQALNNANYNIEPHSARAALAMVPGQFGPVPSPEVVKLGTIASVPGGMGAVVGGTLPYTEEAKQQQQDNAANWLERDPEVRCYLPGIPRANYLPFPFQVFHNEKALFFAYEFADATRNVYLEDPGEPPADSWMGQSSATWEQDHVGDQSGWAERSHLV